MKLSFFLVLALTLALSGDDDSRTYYGGTEFEFWSGRREYGLDKKIYAFDAPNTEVLFYEDECGLKDISASPDGRYVAAISLSARCATGPSYRLKVLDSGAKVIITVDSVIKYVWSPSSEEIAYITGRDREGGVGFKPTGLWVLDLRSLRRERTGYITYDMHWADFDGNIYFLDYTSGGVIKYNRQERKTYRTAYKGIYFSPTGEYYFTRNYDAILFRLYSADNLDITQSISRATNVQVFEPEPQWLDGSLLLIRDWTNARDNLEKSIIFDVKSRTIKSTVKGRLINPRLRGDELTALVSDSGMRVIKMKVK